MITGPYPKGHWTAAVGHQAWGPLTPGRRYQVTRAFEDFDADPHPVGETWTFLGSNFSPYHGGLSLFVSLDGEQEWHIRMQESDQAEVLGNLEAYLRLID